MSGLFLCCKKQISKNAAVHVRREFSDIEAVNVASNEWMLFTGKIMLQFRSTRRVLYFEPISSGWCFKNKIYSYKTEFIGFKFYLSCNDRRLAFWLIIRDEGELTPAVEYNPGLVYDYSLIIRLDGLVDSLCTMNSIKIGRSDFIV